MWKYNVKGMVYFGGNMFTNYFCATCPQTVHATYYRVVFENSYILLKCFQVPLYKSKLREPNPSPQDIPQCFLAFYALSAADNLDKVCSVKRVDI